MFERLKDKQAQRKAAAAGGGEGEASIKLYVDIVSPFGHIAFHALENEPAFSSVRRTYVPVFLGGIMHQTDNRPPLSIKNKNVWVDEDRRRWARYFNVPMAHTSIEGFPPNTLPVGRALTALAASHPDRLPVAIAALYDVLWVRRLPVQEPERLLAALAGVLPGGEADARDVLQRAGTQEVKSQLTANTTEALDTGAFGLPWFICRNARGEEEKLWGVDHLGVALDFLGLDRPAGGSRGMRAVL